MRAKEFLKFQIAEIKEQGAEDVAAWEYRAELQSGLQMIDSGFDPIKVVTDLGFNWDRVA